MTNRRDLTQVQFDAACKARGFRRDHMGYYELGDTGTLVYAHNGGDKRRSQLAYLIKEHCKACERYLETIANQEEP